MRFGNGKGIRFKTETFSLEVVDAEEDLLVHDETNAVIARLLIDLATPVALGVIYRQQARTFDAAFVQHHATGMKRTRSVREFLAGPSPWVVE